VGKLPKKEQKLPLIEKREETEKKKRKKRDHTKCMG
jgi:hypothetical protein